MRKPENPGKNSQGNNKLNSNMTPGLGIEPRAHWWEVNGLTSEPPLRVLPGI